MLRFAQAPYLLLLLLIPGYLYLDLRVRKTKKLALPNSRLRLLLQLSEGKQFWKYFYPVLRSLILFCLIIALARPQWGTASRDFRKKGVDIAIALDVSGSMLALDFLPQNRLGAAVKVAKDFVSRRPNDRFALVSFSEYAVTCSPLSYDHAAVMSVLDHLEVNIEASGTAIGMGLAKAVARLKDSDAKSRIVILITDGVNNTGEIDPISAARMAEALDIKVYPIGVGRGGMVPFPYSDPFFGTHNIPTLIELDMQTLDRIAEITKTGKASKAEDATQLREIMKELDALQRSPMSGKINYQWAERFPLFLMLALILIGLEILCKSYILPILPE